MVGSETVMGVTWVIRGVLWIRLNENSKCLLCGRDYLELSTQIIALM
jgi:hypothetical protein